MLPATAIVLSIRFDPMLWQVDIIGRVRFPFVGGLYFILTLDVYSRFLLPGAFFFRQFKVNVFLILYWAFLKCRILKAIISDRCSQFKSS